MYGSKSFSYFLRLSIAITLLSFYSDFAQAQSSIWQVPKSAINVKNPVAQSAASAQSGKALYSTYCTPCHGKKGSGDGPAAAALNPKPADHTSAKVQAESDGTLFWKLSEGHSPMPAYQAVLTATQRWDLVNYIRTLAKKK
jgi:mono/diheme cytochrome c family protein